MLHTILVVMVMMFGNKHYEKYETKDYAKAVRVSHSTTMMTLRVPRNYCKGYWKNECM